LDTASAANGVFFPNFFPSARKFGFASSVTSASPLVAISMVLMFNSVANTGNSVRSSSSFAFGATHTIRDSG
jgi:hypothetical protein